MSNHYNSPAARAARQAKYAKQIAAQTPGYGTAQAARASVLMPVLSELRKQIENI